MSLSAGAAACCSRWASRSSTSGPTRSSAAAATSRVRLRLRPALRARAARHGPATRRRPARCSRTRSPPSGAGEAETDGFNALVLRAGLTWRQAMVLRAYAKYLRQAGIDVQPGLHRAVPAGEPAARRGCWCGCSRPASTRPLRRTTATESSTRLVARRSPAPSTTSPASTRTASCAPSSRSSRPRCAPTYFQPGADGATASPYVVVQARPAAGARPAAAAAEVRDLGLLARGSRACTCASARSPAAGCAGRTAARTSAPRCSAWSRRRWSRTRSSCRSAPRAASSSSSCPSRPIDREAWLAEGIACYRTFISALLDVTDNLRRRQPVVPPPRRGPPRRRRPLPGGRRRQGHRDVLRHRQRARHRLRLLARRRVRLRRLGRLRPQGDGHHRARRVGVGQAALPRARRRHPAEDFTVVGVGDMSGDVFGNGMLLSEHIRLVAAFDHRHIFLDPTPDAGGVVRRAAPAVRPAALVVGRLRPVADLARAAASTRARRSRSRSRRRCARRSGIAGRRRRADAGRADAARSCRRRSTCSGTAASAPTSRRRTESHADVGDKANDAIRVDGARAALPGRRRGRQPRPHPARPDRVPRAAAARINTDAIDNSAGVDTSDHEVNIKILLDQVVRDGDLTPEAAQRRCSPR